jgi:hypothetical protein
MRRTIACRARVLHAAQSPPSTRPLEGSLLLASVASHLCALASQDVVDGVIEVVGIGRGKRDAQAVTVSAPSKVSCKTYA